MGKYTREAVAAILGNEELTPKQKEDRLFSLYGQAISEGYVSITEAQTATQTAVQAAQQEWEKNTPKPDIKETPEYKSLESEFSGYRAMQEARGSDDYKGVKGKFFETVYGMIDRAENARPVSEQLADIRKDYEEYFNPQPEEDKPKNLPQYSQNPGHTGTNPESEEEKLYKQLSAQW